MDSYDCDLDPGFSLCAFDDAMDDEDFGLAKSFSTAPFGMIAPMQSLASAEQSEDKEAIKDLSNEIRSDGFNFKLHPVNDQVQFQRDLK